MIGAREPLRKCQPAASAVRSGRRRMERMASVLQYLWHSRRDDLSSRGRIIAAVQDVNIRRRRIHVISRPDGWELYALLLFRLDLLVQFLRQLIELRESFAHLRFGSFVAFRVFRA